jgi:hypothetical protein
MATAPKTTERSDAPKATPRASSHALDSTMVGQTLVSGPGAITGIAMVAQGETAVVSDGFGRTPVSGYFALTDGSGGPRLVGFYANDMAGGAFARPLSIPFVSGLVAAAVPRGSSWSITTV